MPDVIHYDIPHRFELRDYQVPAWKAWTEGKKRIVCAWHRGAGKDLMWLNALIHRMVQEPAVYLHCFPQYSQGKRAIWSSVHQTHTDESMSYLDHFPAELIKYKNSTEMRIELVNGAIYCVMGIDGKNAQLARGMNPKHVILSEYAYMDPESWYTLEPRVSQNNGTAIFLSTPNGQNHFYHLFNHAQTGRDKDFFSSLLTMDDTKVLPNDHLDKLRDQGYPEDLILQEYFCSFTRGAEGSYYGRQIAQARSEERITPLNISPDFHCLTAWDFGVGDSSAIFIFQCLKNGKYNFLHYYENNNEGLEHYVQYLERWKETNKAIWGTHYVPHDMRVKEFSTGVDRLSAARNLGYSMSVVPMSSVDDGIQAVRSLLPHCSFDSRHCKKGIDCLDFYRKKWNESLKVYYDTPLHDRWSHGADAFRYAAVGLKSLGTGEGRLSPEKINEMRMRNLGY